MSTKAAAESDTKKKSDAVDILVGNRVRARRTAIGLSQEKLGYALGVTFQQVQKYERGTNRIGASRLQRTAEVLGVPIAYFFEGAEQLETLPISLMGEENGVLEFLKTSEGTALNTAFNRIHDPNVRKKVISLVQTIARNEPTAG